MATRTDPDDTLVVVFKLLAQPNPQKSLKEGRPIFDDLEVCEIRAPGSKDIKVFPATAFARWVDDPMTGELRAESYAERFGHQFRQFRSRETQTKSGMPLDLAPFLTDARRAELRASNVYTVEQLAAIEGNELKNLGPGGRDMKNKAEEYIAEGRASAPNKQMAAELEALKARNAILEEDMKAVKLRDDGVATGDAEFDAMSLDQMREYITTNTGQAPHGSLNRKTLTRMCQAARPKAA